MARLDNDQTSFRTLSLVGTKSYAVSIPIEVIRQLHWNKGEILIVKRIGTNILISRKETK